MEESEDYYTFNKTVPTIDSATLWCDLYLTQTDRLINIQYIHEGRVEIIYQAPECRVDRLR